MEINVRDDRKIVEVWLTNQEKRDQALGDQLKNLYQQYGKKKYFIAVFMSGSQELAEETSALLCYNRKQLAEQEVRSNKMRTPRQAGAR